MRTVILLGALIPSLLLAQDDPKTEAAKAEVSFDNWPGRSNPLKRGFDFRKQDYPTLSLFTVTADRIVTDSLPNGLAREIVLKYGARTLTVTFGVGDGSILRAHELFVVHAFVNTQAPIDGTYLRSASRGDITFSSLLDLMFARRNVYVRLTSGYGSQAAGVNLPVLASQIDAKILALPDLNAGEFESLKPQIINYTVTPGTLQAREGQFAVLNLNAVDPTLPSPLPLTSTLESGGSLNVDNSVSPPRISSSGSTGIHDLRLILSNPFLQYRQATASVTVVP